MRLRERDFAQAAKETGHIIDAVRSHPGFAAAGCVLLYMAIPGEVDLSPLLSDTTKRFAIPLVVGDTLELREYSPGALAKGYMDIMEPSQDAPIVKPEEIGFALIPGVAFCRLEDGRVMRLGRGKGFYDRLLPLLRCATAGVCFSYRMVESIPSDPWDVPLDDVFVGC